MTDSTGPRTPSTTPGEIEPLLAGWLPQQRWFAGKGRKASFGATPLAVLATEPAEVVVWTVRLTYDDGIETYQVPLVERREPVGSLEHVLLGTLHKEDGDRWVYDALHDRDVTDVWLENIRHDTTVPTPTGVVRFESVGDVSTLPVGEQSLVLTGEQSNTSLVFGGDAIMKVFRRIEPGANPDIEIHRALTERGGQSVAALRGSVTAEVDGEPYSLAMLQDFMTTATDGWELAKISVRDLMAEGDLHAAEAGGDFAGEAERLGAVTAHVHADLADAFGTSALEEDERRARAAVMHGRLDRALELVPQLAEMQDGLRAAFDAFAEHTGPVVTQRVHGDLHLGQALRTARRWILLDFEGEPAKGLAERRAMDSPLRDVAGMLRSFDYAARHQLVDVASDPQREYRAVEWAERNRDAFCAGYAAAVGRDPREQDVLLRAFEADKAVYEAVYEVRNRPAWLSIPLSSLARLSTPRTGSGTTANDREGQS